MSDQILINLFTEEKEFFSHLNSPKMQILDLPRNLNSLFTESSGEFLIFLKKGDRFLEERGLENLLAALPNYNKVDLIKLGALRENFSKTNSLSKNIKPLFFESKRPSERLKTITESAIMDLSWNSFCINRSFLKIFCEKFEVDFFSDPDFFLPLLICVSKDLLVFENDIVVRSSSNTNCDRFQKARLFGELSLLNSQSKLQEYFGKRELEGFVCKRVMSFVSQKPIFYKKNFLNEAVFLNPSLISLLCALSLEKEVCLNQKIKDIENIYRSPRKLFSSFKFHAARRLRERLLGMLRGGAFTASSYGNSFNGMNLDDLKEGLRSISRKGGTSRVNLFKSRLFFANSKSKDLAEIRKVLNFSTYEDEIDAYAVWCLFDATFLKFYNKAKECSLPVYFFEAGFIRSLTNQRSEPSYSFIVDTRAWHYDASNYSDLEELLSTYQVSGNQKEEARRLIKKITDNYLTKYNHQKIDSKFLSSVDESKKNVLVIDQSFNDASLLLGGADKETFRKMLEDAITENPGARIYFKVHPDTLGQGSSSYYLGSFEDKVIVINEEINPIALLKRMDKVYVATSQMGFEALMCGKEVNVYGRPFYSGWGLTKEKNKWPLRQRNLTLEELFYITYVVYTFYIDPVTHKAGTLDNLLDFIIKNRE